MSQLIRLHGRAGGRMVVLTRPPARPCSLISWLHWRRWRHPVALYICPSSMVAVLLDLWWGKTESLWIIKYWKSQNICRLFFFFGKCWQIRKVIFSYFMANMAIKGTVAPDFWGVFFDRSGLDKEPLLVFKILSHSFDFWQPFSSFEAFHTKTYMD